MPLRTSSRHPKPPTRGMFCLSLVLYGLRIGSENRSKLTVLTFVVLLPLFPHRGGAEGLLVHPVGVLLVVVVVPPPTPLPRVIALVTIVAEPHVLPALGLRNSRTGTMLLMLLVAQNV